MKPDKKSPLKSNPLRNPGQSLDEELSRILEDKIIVYAGAIAFAVFISVTEWFRWFRPHPPYPKLFTLVALLVSLFCGFKLIQTRKQILNIRLGRDGERAVGQYLEKLRKMGAEVFHDVVSNDFNIDHVVIHENGVFLIETKTYRKPRKGQAVIQYKGDTLQFNNGFESNQAIIQAKAGASWLKNLILESTGKQFTVRPVIVFPGWYIQWTDNAKQSPVWVLNPKALPDWVCKGRFAVSHTDVHLISYHLSRYIRTFESKNQ